MGDAEAPRLRHRLAAARRQGHGHQERGPDERRPAAAAEVLSYADKNNLRINLGRPIKPGEEYMVYIDYVAKPDELKVEGSRGHHRRQGPVLHQPRQRGGGQAGANLDAGRDAKLVGLVSDHRPAQPENDRRKSP
ncbi:MAG: hypothetical protein WKG07_01045 [Hymenobacter sp.]